MADIFNWITANWTTICSIGFGVIILASLIVKLTPSTKDDGVVADIVKALDNISIAKTDRDKELIAIAKKISEENVNKETDETK